MNNFKKTYTFLVAGIISFVLSLILIFIPLIINHVIIVKDSNAINGLKEDIIGFRYAHWVFALLIIGLIGLLVSISLLSIGSIMFRSNWKSINENVIFEKTNELKMRNNINKSSIPPTITPAINLAPPIANKPMPQMPQMPNAQAPKMPQMPNAQSPVYPNKQLIPPISPNRPQPVRTQPQFRPNGAPPFVQTTPFGANKPFAPKNNPNISNRR